MSFDYAAVRQALVDFAKEAHPSEWIFANQEGDRPPRPYGTILISDVHPIGQGDVELEGSGDQVIERMREVFEIDVSFQAIGRVAFDAIEDLKTHARRPSTVIGTLNTVLLGFMSSSQTRDLAIAISAGFENRAQADFQFSVRFCSDLAISTIKRVDILGAEGNQTTSQTVEIP